MRTPITLRVKAGLLADVRWCGREDDRTPTNFIEPVLRRKVAQAPSAISRPGAASASRSKDKSAHVA